jgi:hypothetical protein
MTAKTAYENAATYGFDEPTPLVRPMPPAEEYPAHALGPLWQVAAAMQDRTQAPIAICAQAALGVAALAAQGIADAETLHGRAPCSLFLLTLAQSGERKSTCDQEAMRGVRDFEAELAESHKVEKLEHRNRLDIWLARRAEILKPGKGDQDPNAKLADLDALGPEPDVPLSASIVSADPTIEGIVRHMPNLRPSLGLFSDEGGAFIGGHGMSSENRLKTMAGLSGLWDGKPANRWRAGDGVSTFPGRRLSMHLMVQPVAAAGLLADPIANGQGFLARFLVTEPASAIGTRLREGRAPASQDVVDSFNRRIGDMLRRPLPLREGTTNQLDLPLLPMSDDARELLQDFAFAMEKAQATGGPLEAARPFASKAAEHAARVVAVMTLYEDPDAREVSDETMANAIDLVRYYVGEAARLSGAASISIETSEATRLLQWLLETWSDPFISVADAVRLGPNQLRESDKVKRAFAVLEKHGWVVPVEGGASVKGKHRRAAWRIVRGAGT